MLKVLVREEAKERRLDSEILFSLFLSSVFLSLLSNVRVEAGKGMKRKTGHVGIHFFPPTLINVQPLLLPTTQKRQWKRKVIQISGEVDLFNNSCLGVSSIFFISSSVLWQTPSTNQQLQCSLLTSRLHTGPSRCCPVLSAGRHQARTSNCGSILRKQ